MLQGTKNTGKGYICAACETLISPTIEDITNFCSNCGNPLKLKSIIETKKMLIEEKLAIVDKIEDMHKDNVSFSKIIENIKFEINNL